MLAEDSSSANADILATLLDLEWASAGILKVSVAEGPSFFLRDEYAEASLLSALEPGLRLSPEQTEALLFASHCYLAERDAVAYLARAEHCRFQLSVKLARKGHLQHAIARALDYLEQKNWLSDRRFAEAWLRSRSIHRAEGRSRLVAELRSRGVSAEIAEESVSASLSPEDEESRCMKAAERFIARGREGNKLVTSLSRAGFSHQTIKTCLKKAGNTD